MPKQLDALGEAAAAGDDEPCIARAHGSEIAFEVGDPP
jgi:hypothetical protein